MIMISDSAVQELREVAQELLDARSDNESVEAIRAFLTICHTHNIGVDETGELASQ